jgi:uracil-DNA glycosylase
MSGAKQFILKKHLTRIRACGACPLMEQPPIDTYPAFSPVVLLLPPPTDEEHKQHKRLSGRCGEIIKNWLSTIGLVDEEAIQRRIYMASVCRCFCGYDGKGELREPDQKEIDSCQVWLDREMIILQPKLIIPVGKTAISLLLPPDSRESAVGGLFSVTRKPFSFDVIPLPDYTKEQVSDSDPLLKRALSLIQSHPVYESLL